LEIGFQHKIFLTKDEVLHKSQNKVRCSSNKEKVKIAEISSEQIEFIWKYNKKIPHANS